MRNCPDERDCTFFKTTVLMRETAPFLRPHFCELFHSCNLFNVSIPHSPRTILLLKEVSFSQKNMPCWFSVVFKKKKIFKGVICGLYLAGVECQTYQLMWLTCYMPQSLWSSAWKICTHVIWVEEYKEAVGTCMWAVTLGSVLFMQSW